MPLIGLFCFAGTGQNDIHAQRSNPTAQKDTTSLLYKKYFGPRDSTYTRPHRRHRRNAPWNPDYYKLFVPLTYYFSATDKVTTNKWKPARRETMPEWTKDVLPFDTVMYTYMRRTDDQVSEVLRNTYMNRPDLVVYTEEGIRRITSFKSDVEVAISPKAGVLGIFKPEKAISDVGEADVLIHKPNFWTKGGNASLQVTQNYVSDNWYNGGESATSLLGNLKFYSNYNDKEKVQFENLLESKVGFNNVPSDTLRKYRINTDMFRIYSKLGIQAAHKWYYTISGEFNTQLFNNYSANSTKVISAFMAPANLMFSVGMDYKLAKPKFNLSVFISPLAYNFRYVGDNRVDETKHGLEEGRKTMNDYGSKLQTTISWTIIPSIKWDSRLYYFSNYKKVESEWENTVNFVLNRYLSTKIFVHLRYDDGVARTDDKSYFQVKELLSFGVNYTW